MAKVAFLGLGVMGFPMAGHLVEKGGHEVTVFNRTAAKAKAWAEKFGGKAASTPEAAAEGQDFVIACVGNDNDLRAITIGAGGAFAGMKPGSIFVDHTTASAEVARELDAEATRRGFGFMDAPVSGGQAGAENGFLTVMCGGEEDAYARAEPIIAAYARMCKRIGPAGAGQLTKMVNQICIAGLVEGLSEGIHFAKKAGLDVNAVVEVISKGAAQSWQMENRSQDDERRQVRFRLCRRMDAQGSFDLHLRGPSQRRKPAGHEPCGRLLLGSRDDGRQPLGHVQPSGATRTLTAVQFTTLPCPVGSPWKAVSKGINVPLTGLSCFLRPPLRIWREKWISNDLRGRVQDLCLVDEYSRR